MVKKSAAPATAPAKKTPAKKAGKKETSAREAFKAPVDGDTGQPADVDTAAPMTSEQASQPDKKAQGGDWGLGEAAETNVGWGLDGSQQMVDEEGNDASEAAKVAEANKPKGPRVRKNKPEPEEEGVNLTGMARDLVNGVERIERLNEERSAIGDDIKEVFAELKAMGYSTPIIRKVISRRAMDPEKRKEQDQLLDLYEEALGSA